MTPPSPYCWSHPMSIDSSSPYYQDYACNSAYVQTNMYKMLGGSAFVANHYPKATCFILTRWDTDEPAVTWTQNPVFITELSRRLGVTDPYQFHED